MEPIRTSPNGADLPSTGVRVRTFQVDAPQVLALGLDTLCNDEPISDQNAEIWSAADVEKTFAPPSDTAAQDASPGVARLYDGTLNCQQDKYSDISSGQSDEINYQKISLKIAEAKSGSVKIDTTLRMYRPKS